MSSAEPFMPAHEPVPEPPATERDVDSDVDVIFGDADEAAEAEPVPDFGAVRTPFHPPVPGVHLSEDELERDLDERAPD